jgi:hypothetical protein
MRQSNWMDLSVYEHLLAVNAGFEQVRRALAALGQRRGFERGEVTRFAAIAEEARAAIASYLTEVIAAAETQKAGRLSSRRLVRERTEEGP